MPKKNSKSEINWKRMLSSFFTLVLNLYLLYRIIVYSFFPEYVALLFFLVLFWNVRYIVKTIQYLREKPQRVRPSESLTPLLDALDFAVPLDETIFPSPGKETSPKADPETAGEREEMAEEKSLPDIPETSAPENPVSPEVPAVPAPAPLPPVQRPKRFLPCEPIYDQAVNANRYCDELTRFLSDSGLSVDQNNVREMFSCLAASRLILAESDNSLLSERFVEVFSDFIGAILFTDEIRAGFTGFEDLFSDEYHFKDCFSSARNRPDLIHIMVLRQVDLGMADQHFAKLIDHSLNPLLPWAPGKNSGDSAEDFPENIWVVLLPADSGKGGVSEKMAQGAMRIGLNAKTVSPQDEVRENPLKLSLESFESLLLYGYERFYLEEADWKKMDQVEQYARKYSSFSLDNRIFRQMERYTSTFLLFGGEKNEAVDCILFNKILCLISSEDPRFEQGTEEDLMSVFEKLFGLENLPRSKSMLKEIIASSQEKQ